MMSFNLRLTNHLKRISLTIKQYKNALSIIYLILEVGLAEVSSNCISLFHAYLVPNKKSVALPKHIFISIKTKQPVAIVYFANIKCIEDVITLGSIYKKFLYNVPDSADFNEG